MALNIHPVTNHREREKGVIVYPVYSRRAGGLSIGINLFPDKKKCQFNCPYCEVFPFSSNAEFSIEQMESDLRSTIAAVEKQNTPIKDICFSGNGEPTLSPAFTDAFKLAEGIHAETASASQLVIITNGTGLLQPQIFSALKDAASNPSVNIWLKTDAGTQDWYQKMNRCTLPYEKLIEKIKEFSARADVTIQTMLCAIDGQPPPDIEAQAWISLICQLAANGGIRKAQIYGKARSAPEDPKASALPVDYLKKRASSLRNSFTERNITTPIEIYP